MYPAFFIGILQETNHYCIGIKLKQKCLHTPILVNKILCYTVRVKNVNDRQVELICCLKRYC